MTVQRVAEIEDRWSQDQLVAGAGLSSWLRILSDNQWRVDAAYLHRAAWITGLAAPTSAIGAVERAMWGKRVAEYQVDPTPIFLLGHWRSGTTHLHNLFGRDPAHTYSTVYQAVFPEIFLSTGKLGPKLLKNALTETRTYDAVKQGWHEAAEDEIALMKLTGGLSFYTALLFPDRAQEYERYIDFHGATDEERQRFKDALLLFIKKIMLATGGKRVVVKSCAHSARIPMLLELFPNARFVHVHRHPARVFASMMHMRAKVDWENFMHRPTVDFIADRREHTALIGERLFSRLVQDRAIIPPENLVEIGYDELCGHELDVIGGIYKRFGMDWDSYEPVLADYLKGVGEYKVNKLNIDDELLDFVRDRWSIMYDTYGYGRTE